MFILINTNRHEFQYMPDVLQNAKKGEHPINIDSELQNKGKKEVNTVTSVRVFVAFVVRQCHYEFNTVF